MDGGKKFRVRIGRKRGERCSGSGLGRDRKDDHMAMSMNGNLQLTGIEGREHFQEETEAWNKEGAQDSME